MYEKFYDELFESGKYAIHSICDGWKYVLIRNKDKDLVNQKCIEVSYKSDDDLTCACGLFEHMGMLCRHALKVITLGNFDKCKSLYICILCSYG